MLQFYVEPGTGKKFRSLPEVRRYLMDGKTDMPATEVSEEAGDKSDVSLVLEVPCCTYFGMQSLKGV